MSRHPPHRTPSPRQAGVTLIELMVVIAILGIIAALAVPSFNTGIAKRRLIGAAENMAANLRLAQSEAAKRHRTIVVGFETSGGAWCYGASEVNACDCNGDGTNADGTTTPLACTISGQTKVVSSVDYPGVTMVNNTNDANDNFNFSPIRNTTEDGNVEFTDAVGKKARVVVSGSVGRIRFCSPAAARISEYPAC